MEWKQCEAPIRHGGSNEAPVLLDCLTRIDIMSLHSCHFIPRHRSGEKGGQCVTLHMFAARLRPDRSDLFAESGLVRGRLPEDLELDYLKKRPSDRDRRF